MEASHKTFKFFFLPKVIHGFKKSADTFALHQPLYKDKEAWIFSV
jgi:hypothetical protein